MGADQFKSNGIQLQLGGRRGTPALGPQGGGVAIVGTQPPAMSQGGGAPGFSIKTSAPGPSQQTAPLGGSKIPSMKTSQAGGGARDSFSPAQGGQKVRLMGANAPVLGPETQPQPAMAAAPAQPAPTMAGGGGEEVILCEAIAEMPDGQRWSAPYEAVFPKGAKFLGVRTTAAR